MSHPHPIPIQCFDTQDQYGNAFSDWSNPRPLIYAARFGWTIDSDGIPKFGPVDNTLGAVGGAVFLGPGGTARKLGQWNLGGGVPCKVTQASPLKVQPIKTASTLAKDSDLSDFEVFSGGGTPAVDQAGTVYQCSDLGSKQLLFFAGSSGSGGGGMATDNSDGDVHLDGVTGTFLSGFGPAPSYGIVTDPHTSRPNVYYAQRPLWINRLTIDSGVILCGGPWPIYVKTLVGSGKISVCYDDFFNVHHGNVDDNGAGVTSAYGDGRPAHGGLGYNTNCRFAGSPVFAGSYGIPKLDNPLVVQCYGNGGLGGSWGGSSGTPGGAATVDGAFDREWLWDRQKPFMHASVGGGCWTSAGSYTNGSYGGKGSGTLLLVAIDISGFTGTLSAKGGMGQDADYIDGLDTGRSIGGGGGGGGGGGYISLSTKTASLSCTLDVTGGAGGLGGSDTSAATGTAGLVGKDGTTSIRVMV